MTPRVATSVLVGALIRKAQGEGGFAAVLAKGDATAGSVIVVLAERGGKAQIFERILQTGGNYSWQPAGAGNETVSEIVARGRRFDPDLWVVELDVPSAERFAAEMNLLD